MVVFTISLRLLYSSLLFFGSYQGVKKLNNMEGNERYSLLVKSTDEHIQ